MKKNILLYVTLLFCIPFASDAQYYNSAFGLNGTSLKSELHQIIKNHTALSYSDLWTEFQQTDKKPDNTVWDIYTDVPGGVPSITFQFVTDQCGNYNAEGDCYNREHSWPSSYFNDALPMYTDLHHIYPTDGWVNNKRAAFPYGNVSAATYSSSNGCKLGNGNTYSGYTDNIFEPVDSFKGDLARTYFYMSTRYEGEDAGWNQWVMATGAQLTPDAVSMLLNWHHNDPVSQKEVERNIAIAGIQNNRNPFIDYPLFADCIWGTADCISIGIADRELSTYFKIYPVPATHELNIESAATIKVTKISVLDLSGRIILQQDCNALSHHKVRLDISRLPEGNFLILMNTSKGVHKRIFTKN